MTDYMLGIIGIAVSVGLFLIGYRKTVGAKKERIAGANAELAKILVRRIVLEKYAPSEAHLARLIEGKARDYRVRPGELLSETQLLNTIYTRIVESDLIPAEQRNEILDRIAPALSASEIAPVPEQIVEEVETSDRLARRTRADVALMAVMTSMVGGLVAVAPDIREFQARIPELLPAIAAIALASLGVIAALYTVLRLRATQEEVSGKTREVSHYLRFEEQVRELLERLAGRVRVPNPREAGDFLIEQGGRSILVEVKAWSRPVPSAILRRIAHRLREALNQTGATEAVIVTTGPIPHAKEVLPEEVKLMTLREFRNYLAHSTE